MTNENRKQNIDQIELADLNPIGAYGCFRYAEKTDAFITGSPKALAVTFGLTVYTAMCNVIPVGLIGLGLEKLLS